MYVLWKRKKKKNYRFKPYVNTSILLSLVSQRIKIFFFNSIQFCVTGINYSCFFLTESRLGQYFLLSYRKIIIFISILRCVIIKESKFYFFYVLNKVLLQWHLPSSQLIEIMGQASIVSLLTQCQQLGPCFPPFTVFERGWCLCLRSCNLVYFVTYFWYKKILFFLDFACVVF